MLNLIDGFAKKSFCFYQNMVIYIICVKYTVDCRYFNTLVE